MDDAPVSINALRERYEREILDVSTDLTTAVFIAPSEDGEAIVVAFLDYPVTLVAEDDGEPWTLEGVAEALGVAPATLDTVHCAVNLSISPTFADDEERDGNSLLVNLEDSEGEYQLFGYAWANDGREWSLETVAEAFAIPHDAPVWDVADPTVYADSIARVLAEREQGE